MKRQVFSTREIAAYLLQAARAVQALHSAGVVHGAINEENLLITPDGAVKLDPVPRAKRGDLKPAADVTALGILGLRLACGKYYSPNVAALPWKDSWKLELHHPEVLTGFIKALISGRVSIDSAVSELEKIAAMTASDTKPFQIKVILAGLPAFFMFAAVPFLVLTVLCVLAAVLGTY